MDKIDRLLIIILLLVMLLAGFSITINSFHWEFKGLISIVFKLFTGKDL